jgi:hypothetical protein
MPWAMMPPTLPTVERMASGSARYSPVVTMALLPDAWGPCPRMSAAP